MVRLTYTPRFSTQRIGAIHFLEHKATDVHRLRIGIGSYCSIFTVSTVSGSQTASRIHARALLHSCVSVNPSRNACPYLLHCCICGVFYMPFILTNETNEINNRQGMQLWPSRGLQYGSAGTRRQTPHRPLLRTSTLRPRPRFNITTIRLYFSFRKRLTLPVPFHLDRKLHDFMSSHLCRKWTIAILERGSQLFRDSSS
ncbi:hypothetical protein M426DRAFT_233709 [Hypoxylon sp. CI-4A]|nr:hypothetical protein M426DRAFT_233709 [Hypoxylon sp. CI-4A]